MGRMKRKYESGAATNYISRAKALKKLQISLKDFRRICILKGIFPHEPKHKKKVNRGSTENKTWYYAKDIVFLLHEPVLNSFREYKVFLRKLKRALSKKEADSATSLRDSKPIYTLDHIVRERFSTFVDALRDLEDPLCMCFLFSRLPKSGRLKAEKTDLCRKLTIQFMHYIIATRSLRKVFVSIKGVYYQVEVMGQTITWIVPHERGHTPVNDVDFAVMSTFLEFYTAMLGFVCFKLFTSLGMVYPPKLEHAIQEADGASDEYSERIASLNQALRGQVTTIGVPGSSPDATEDDLSLFNQDKTVERIEQQKLEERKVEGQKRLFEGCNFFLGREVARESLTFIIRCCGGNVSWDPVMCSGASFSETDSCVTHQIVDRPIVGDKHLERWYVQPQWVYDCINAREKLAVEKYFVGAVLPPHLSPFMAPPVPFSPEDLSEIALLAEKEMGPPPAKKVKPARKDKEFAVEKSKPKKLNAVQTEKQDENEQLKLREMMIPKRYRHAYHKIKRGKKMKAKEDRALLSKKKAAAVVSNVKSVFSLQLSKKGKS